MEGGAFRGGLSSIVPTTRYDFPLARRSSLQVLDRRDELLGSQVLYGQAGWAKCDGKGGGRVVTVA